MSARLVYPIATKNRKQREQASRLPSEMMLVLLILLLSYVGKMAVIIDSGRDIQSTNNGFYI
jgi:hypothetical protein